MTDVNTIQNNFGITIVGIMSLFLFIASVVAPICGNIIENREIKKSYERTQDKDRAMLMLDNELRNYEFIQYNLLRLLKEKMGISNMTNGGMVYIRKSMLEKKQVTAWKKLFTETEEKFIEYNKRADLIDDHIKDIHPDDVLSLDEAKEKLFKDVTDTMASIAAVKISHIPRLAPEIKAEISGTSSAFDGLDEGYVHRIAAIEETLQSATKSLPTSLSEEAYLITEIQDRYIPDTLKAYSEARKTDPSGATLLFDEQIQILEHAAQETSTAVLAGNIDILRANGNFLKLRLGQPTT